MSYEKKPVSVITTVAGMAGAVIAMIIGSLFGTGGTLWGAALGSGVSATAATVFENGARRTRARFAAEQEQQEAETRIQPGLSWAGDMIIQPERRDSMIRARQRRILSRERSPWKTAGIGAGVLAGCFLVAVAVLLGVESATGKTLHSTLTGGNQRGTSFSYTTKAPASSPATVIPSTSTTPVISSTPSPDASPSVISGSGGPSSTTPDPAGTPTSSASPTLSPGGPTAPAGNAVPSSSATGGL
jgi:hypothetical protein